MRAFAALPMLLLALPSCKRGTAGAADAGDGAAFSASAAPSSSAPLAASPAEPVPGQYGRYYIDNRRFSAAFPVSPELKPMLLTLAVESKTDDGAAFVIICRAASQVRNELEHAKEQTVGTGKLLAEARPSFYGGEAYDVSAKLEDGSERFMRFVRYAGRFCSVGAEIPSSLRESDATRFVASFRPEPPPAGAP
jgi:hypothetical protein